MPFLVRRLLYSLFLLAGVSVLTFVLVDLAPGEFFDELRLNPRVSQATIAALRSHYGLDLPLPVKYLRWLQSAAKGECGFSFSYDSPAAPIVWLSVVLDDGRPHPRHGQRRAVQRVHDLGALPPAGAVADVGPAGLVVAEPADTTRPPATRRRRARRPRCRSCGGGSGRGRRCRSR